MSGWQPVPFVRDLDQQQREAAIRDYERLEADIEVAMVRAKAEGNTTLYAHLAATWGVHHLTLKRLRHYYDEEYRPTHTKGDTHPMTDTETLQPQGWPIHERAREALLVYDSTAEHPDDSKWLILRRPDGARLGAYRTRFEAEAVWKTYHADPPDPDPASLRSMQEAVRRWNVHNFPLKEAHQPLLGIMEEGGELAHAHLKAEQNIRGTPEEHYAAKVDAIGDLMIYVLDYCNQCGIDAEQALQTAWNEIKDRDWIAYPRTGKPPIVENIPTEPYPNLRMRIGEPR